MSRFTPTETNIRYLSGVGYFGSPPAKGLHKVSAHLIQDFWPPYPATEIILDPSALLQSDGWFEDTLEQ